MNAGRPDLYTLFQVLSQQESVQSIDSLLIYSASLTSVNSLQNHQTSYYFHKFMLTLSILLLISKPPVASSLIDFTIFPTTVVRHVILENDKQCIHSLHYNHFQNLGMQFLNHFIIPQYNLSCCSLLRIIVNFYYSFPRILKHRNVSFGYHVFVYANPFIST